MMFYESNPFALCGLLVCWRSAVCVVQLEPGPYGVDTDSVDLQVLAMSCDPATQPGLPRLTTNPGLFTQGTKTSGSRSFKS